MTSVTTYDLIEACRKPGCPVCRLEQKYVERYIDNQFYENVNDPGFREVLRYSLGFCPEHAWLTVHKHLGDALGFALIYHDILGNVLKKLDRNVPLPPRPRTGWLRRLPEGAGALVYRVMNALTPQKRCPVCQKRDEMTAIILTSLLEDLHTPELKAAFQASEGICLPHLRLALKEVRDEAAAELLIGLQREKMESLRAELAELIRKNDYRFAKEPLGKEGDSWLRAVRMMTGNKDAEG